MFETEDRPHAAVGRDAALCLVLHLGRGRPAAHPPLRVGIFPEGKVYGLSARTFTQQFVGAQGPFPP